jgi:hypothetical protein
MFLLILLLILLGPQFPRRLPLVRELGFGGAGVFLEDAVAAVVVAVLVTAELFPARAVEGCAVWEGHRAVIGCVRL